MDRDLVEAAPKRDPGAYAELIRMRGDRDAPGLVLTLADLGQGHNLFIDVHAPDWATWTEFVAAAMPIIASFEMQPPKS